MELDDDELEGNISQVMSSFALSASTQEGRVSLDSYKCNHYRYIGLVTLPLPSSFDQSSPRACTMPLNSASAKDFQHNGYM